MSLAIPSNDSAEYLLYNTNNYCSHISDDFSNILAKFAGVVLDYLRFIADRLATKNNMSYRFILERGLSTITHVFSIIFYYTKNLELTYYHSQKAYYFYVEFIEQISDDNVTFLKLSSRDASTFVYKKTIYELNMEYKRNMPEPSNSDLVIFSYLETYTYIYRNIINHIIQNNDFTNSNKVSYINEGCTNIYNVHRWLYNSKFKKHHIDIIYTFTNILVERCSNTKVFFSLLESFTKTLGTKKKINEQQISNKLMQHNDEHYDDMNALLIEWIFTD